jgi:hypothetical protein
MKSSMLLMIMMTATLPPSKPLDDNYVAVRKDVFETLNLSDINLPKCEVKLADAQRDLALGQININELHSAAKALEGQKRDLELHIERLGAVIKRYEDYTAAVVAVSEQTKPGLADQLFSGWEEVDGSVGLFAGYALGTGTCVGMAYVFNQPAFGGNAP